MAMFQNVWCPLWAITEDSCTKSRETSLHHGNAMYTRTNYSDGNGICRRECIWIATATNVGSSIRESCSADGESCRAGPWIIRIREWNSWCRWAKRDSAIKSRGIKATRCCTRREAVEVPVSSSRWPSTCDGYICTSEYHEIVRVNVPVRSYKIHID